MPEVKVVNNRWYSVFHLLGHLYIAIRYNVPITCPQPRRNAIHCWKPRCSMAGLLLISFLWKYNSKCSIILLTLYEVWEIVIWFLSIWLLPKLYWVGAILFRLCPLNGWTHCYWTSSVKKVREKSAISSTDKISTKICYIYAGIMVILS